MIRALRPIRARGGAAWRFGAANIARRARASVAQIAAFGLGITLILLLTVVREDVLEDWRTSLPPETPNFFLVNVQPDEVGAIEALLSGRGIESASLHPMIRGRLSAINGEPRDPESFTGPRAKRLAAREFNLSHARTVADDNRIVDGAWWPAPGGPERLISVEESIMQAFGLDIGDTIEFQVAGEPVTGRISSVRHVDWDSFRVNFFVLFSPGAIDDAPATYITSFHLPAGRRDVLRDLLRGHPSVTVIDIDALLSKVREVMEKAALGVQCVFAFTLLAGFTVLHAAVQSTLSERRFETAVMRTLGANRRTLISGLVAEFTLIGALAGLLGSVCASGIGLVLAERVFQLSYRPDPTIWAVGLAIGVVAVGGAGYLGTRGVLTHPPILTLREG